VNKRFEAVDKRFEDVNKRFEAIDKRFEDMNKRFEDLTHYIDRRVGLVEKLLIGFNVPILIAIITILVRMIIF
jgi:tetrahydromethanopterin S-methyltransferase subunit G